MITSNTGGVIAPCGAWAFTTPIATTGGFGEHVSPRFKSVEDLEQAFLALVAGENLCYYSGYLSADRCEVDADAPIDPATNERPLSQRAVLLRELQDYALQLEQEGRAELLQRRHPIKPKARFAVYDYFLIKRRVVDEEGRCTWEKFGSRVREGQRRTMPVKGLSTNHFAQRQSFLRRHPHLSPIDNIIHDPTKDEYEEKETA